MTEQERLAAWGPYIAHSGTYVLTGNLLTMSPIVAKNPAVMASNGGGGQSTIRFDGDTILYLIPTDPTGATLKLHRVE